MIRTASDLIAIPCVNWLHFRGTGQLPYTRSKYGSSPQITMRRDFFCVLAQFGYEGFDSLIAVRTWSRCLTRGQENELFWPGEVGIRS